jgi:NAD(P)H-dependent flavin oxidoreductase YrpB (nitropropane dioxygenase family)
MISTRFTELVGCTAPIQLAGMGAAAPPELAAAVSNAGALGMLGTARPGLTVETLTVMLARVRALTTQPFGVNFIVRDGHTITRESFVAAAKAARVVEFFYGEPDGDLVSLVHDNGALAAWQVGSLAEAVRAATAGCDFLVAQGVEAGGHVRGKTGLLPLLGEVLEAVELPVVASGGIGTGRAMAAALVAGADGVRVGTRFLGAAESGAHPAYVAALIAAGAQDTVYTEAFWVNWPGAPHRVLQSCIKAAEGFQGDVVGERDSLDGTRVPIQRFASATADRTTTGAIEAMPLWAGESVGAVKRVRPAREIVEELLRDAATLMQRRQPVAN